MALRFILLVCFSLLSFFSKAQHNPVVYKKLVKRYGTVLPWGNGYIINVMSLHGFADSTGKTKSMGHPSRKSNNSGNFKLIYTHPNNI